MWRPGFRSSLRQAGAAGNIARMAEPSPAAKRRSRIWLIVAVPLVLAAVAWAALTIAFPKSRLKEMTRRQLAISLARDVRFRDVGLTMWPPVRLSVDELALAEPGGFAQGTALQTHALHLDLDVFALVGRRLVVRKLALDRPAVHVLLRADGTTNLDSLGAPPGRKPAKPMDMELDEITVDDGRILIDDVAAKRRTILSISTRSGYSSARDGTIRTQGTSHVRGLRFGPLSAVRDSQLNGSLAKLDWQIEHRAAWSDRAKRLALERLAVAFGGTQLAVSGTVDVLDRRPIVNLRATGRGVDLSEILGYLAAADARLLSGARGGGKLEFDLGVKGAIAGRVRPVVTGTLALRNGSVSYPGVPVGIEKVALDARFAADSLVIPALSARVSGQPVRGSIRVVGHDDPRVRFTLAGKFDLAATSRFLADQDTKLDGKLALDVAGQGRAKDPGSLDVSGWAQIEDGSVLSPKLPKRIDHLSGRFDFSSRQAAIQGLRAQAGKSSFTFDATATRPLALLAKNPPGAERVPPALIDFTLRSSYLDIAELVTPTPGGPLLPNALGHGHVTIDRLKSGRLDVANVSAKVDLSPTEIVASPFRFDGYGGSVSGAATIDVARPARPRVRMQARVDSTQADALLSAWTGAGKIVHGRLGSSIELATDGLTAEQVRSSLTAKGIAQVVNGALGPAPLFESIAAFTRIPSWREVRFKNFEAPFRVENGRVATGPAHLSGSYGEWVIAGTTGFDGALDYAVSVTLPPELVSSLGAGAALAAGALADDKGRVLLDLRVSGNAKSPRVAWDARAMRDRLIGKKSAAILAPILGGKTPRDTLGSLRKAAEDSARAQARRFQRAFEDSVRSAARDALKNLFGKPKRDTTRSP
jgi:hypothetical protein